MVPKHQPEYHGFMIYQWFHDHQKLEFSLVSKKNYGESPVLMGKSLYTIHAHFVCLPEGKSHEITNFPWMFQEISSPPILFRAFSVSSAFRRSSECSGASSPLPQKHGRRFVARSRKMPNFAVKFGVSPCFSVEFRIQQVKFWWFTKKIRG